jgi:hypothetical protein
MGYVLVKYLVRNLAWVLPFGGIFGMGGSSIGRGDTKEIIRRDLVMALTELKRFGKKSWL